MSQVTYQKRLEAHLAEYKVRRLGVEAHGTFAHRGKARAYRHILPRELKWLNVPEAYRREIRNYVTKSQIRLHEGFHHLNSSQAFAFALFYPYLSGRSSALERALGSGPIEKWAFEFVPNKTEGTNVDVWWRSPDQIETFCEVKLSEGEFGPATNDSRHLHKLDTIYRPVLKGHVEDRLLEPPNFFKNYQVLRNLWLVARKCHEQDQLLFLLPKANKKPNGQLMDLLGQVRGSLRARVRIRHVEAVIGNLAAQPTGGDLSWYASGLAEKYLP